MGQERAKVEGHFLASFRRTERLVVDQREQRQLQLATVPGRPKLVRRHRDRREGRRRLRLQEAEALRELGRNEVAQADVVHQQHEPDRRTAFGRGSAHRDRAGNDGDLGLAIDAVVFGADDDRIARAEVRIGGALIHQRIGPERGWKLRAARLAHKLDVIHVGRAVEPLIGARQRRGAIMLVEAEGRHGAMLEAFREILERRSEDGPVVEHGLQVGRDMPCIGRPREIARDDHEASIPPSLERCQFHTRPPLRCVVVVHHSRASSRNETRKLDDAPTRLCNSRKGAAWDTTKKFHAQRI